jgi:hypothetical protein
MEGGTAACRKAFLLPMKGDPTIVGLTTGTTSRLLIANARHDRKMAFMKRRLAVLLVLASMCSGAPALAFNLTAQMFPLTGEVRFRNTSAGAVPFVFYSITSPGNRLNGANGVWLSVEDVYDVSGNGFIDPNGEWVEIAAVPSELAEGSIDLDGGSLAAFRSVSLGKVWSPTPISDLSFDVRESSGAVVTVTRQLALDGDYFADGIVNQTDYAIWRQNLGSTTQLDADGNLNGVVDAADFVVWRNNLNATLAGFMLGSGGGSGLVVGSAVPEPGSIAVALAAMGCLSLATFRSRRRG